MENGYNLYNLEPQFREFLIAENISPISLKNYLSDLRYFFGWMSSKSLKVESIDKELVEEYRKYLLDNNLPHKTVNRRLSTLRKFCSFCISQGWMKENPAKKIGNVTKTFLSIPPTDDINKASQGPRYINSFVNKLLGNFKKKPKKEVEKKNEELSTSKQVGRPSFGLQHYIGFLIVLVFVAILGAGIYNQFFSKTTATLAYPTTLKRAGRILSFQGRLTDSLGNPITAATNVAFNLYNVDTGGTPIYTAGACSITPDPDGIINVLVGGVGYSPTPPSSAYNALCGSEIDPEIFTENANVYLGITVASDSEMTPRQQIANVGYAINAETLQGFPPGTGTSSIPYINSAGDVLIAAANPEINSSYASSTFTISSANATTIQSAGSGDITLQATESGAISLRTGGATSAFTRLFIDTAANSGNVGIGDLTPVATLTVGDGDLFQVAGASGNITTAGDIAVNGGDVTSTSTTLNITAGDTGTTNFKFGTGTLAAIKDQGSYGFWNLAGKSDTGDPATCAEGDMYYNAFDDTIKICHSGNTWEGLDGGGSGSSVWSDLLSPTANLLLNMGTYTSEFNYDTGTGTDNLFNLTTDASSNGTGYLMNLATGTSSTVKPLRISAGGVESLSVIANGNVGIGTTGPAYKLDLIGSLGGSSQATTKFIEQGRNVTPWDQTFEENITGWSAINNTSFTQSSAEAYENTYSFKIQRNDLTGGGGVSYNLGTSLKPGRVYTLSGYYKMVNGAGTASIKLNSNGSTPYTNGTTYTDKTLTNASSWTFFSISITASTITSGSNYVWLAHTMPDITQEIYFDNLVFSEGSLPPTELANMKTSINGLSTYFGGNVGIGDTTPASLFTVGNGDLFQVDTSGDIIKIKNVTYSWPSSQGAADTILANNGSGALSWFDINSSSNAGPWTVGSGSIYPDNSTLDAFIGGTASASAKFAFLNVAGGDPTASISGNLAITAPTGANPATSFDILNGGTLNFRNSVGGNAGLASRFFIDSNGNIGIGTTSPTEKLSLQQDSAADLLGIRDGANNTSLLLADGGQATFKPTAFDAVQICSGVSCVSADTGTFTYRTTEAKSSGGTPYEILPAAAPGSGAFYMGLDHTFGTINIDVVTANIGMSTMLVEYWDGTAWSSVTPTDNTALLTVDGTITFTPPTDWATKNINASTKYYIRLRNSVGTITTAPTAYFSTPTTGDRFSVFAQSGDSTNPSLYVNDLGNVGVGTNTPSTKLSIGGSTSSISNDSGDITIDAASGNIAFNGDSLINFSQALASLGSDSAPSFSFNGDGDTGFYSPAANTVAFSTNGSEKVRIDSSGAVGIGTNSPASTSILDLTSTTKGFLAPRMTTTQRDAISTPATGLMIYNTTTNQYNVYNGSTWGAVGGGGKWSDLAAPTANLSLSMTTYTTAFNWATGTGTNNLFSLTTDSSANGTGSLLNIQTGTSSTVLPFRVRAGSTEGIMVDSGGRIGIGTASPNSSYKLHVAGNILGDAFYDTTSPGTWFLNPGGASSLGGNITMAGNLFLTGGSPLVSSNNGGTYSTIVLKGSNDGTSTSVCIEGTGTGLNCDGKLNAGTIDPPYTINGKKYATYIASMTGIKEETTGKVQTTEKISGVGYRKTIDFNSQPDGSDLWLFAKTSKLRENIRDMVVLLSASDNTRTWFDVDKNNLRLTIYSSKPTTVNYRLTAPRFDTGKWKNTREDNDPVIGFVLNDQGNLNGQSLPVSVAGATLSNTNIVYDGNLDDFVYRNSYFTVVGDFVDEFVASTAAVFGRIKAGFIETQNAVVNNTIVANKAVMQTVNSVFADIKNLVVREKIVSPVIETENIKVSDTAKINKIETNQIKPQVEDVVLDLSDNNNPGAGKLAQLIIKGLEGKTVTTIDSQGNASFSGQVIADSLAIDNDATISGTLTAGQFETNEASVAGKLTAKEIQSDNLTDLENRLTRTASDSSYLASSVNEIQALLAQIQSEPTPDPVTQTDLSTTTDLSSMTLEELNVTGTANVYNLSVSNSMSTGSLLIEDNKILALSWDLNISALSTINFFDGSITMARNGTITTRGELIAEGGIRTDEINPLDDNGNVNINRLAVDSLIINDKYLEATSSAAVIAAADNFELNGLYAPAIETATSSAGIAILPGNSNEVVIYNNNIKEDSLVYLTPTSDYPQSGQLTVVKKEFGIKPYFKVSSNVLSALPVKFNWLIVN